MSLHDYYESGDITGFIEKLNSMTLYQVENDKCPITKMSVLYKVINKKKNRMKHISEADIYQPNTVPSYRKRDFPYDKNEFYARHPYDAVLCEMLLAKGIDPNRGEYPSQWEYHWRYNNDTGDREYFQIYDEKDDRYKWNKQFPLDWALDYPFLSGDDRIVQKLFEYGANYQLIRTGKTNGGNNTPPHTRHLLDHYLLQRTTSEWAPDILRVCIIHGITTDLNTEYVHAATIQDGYNLRIRNNTGNLDILRRNYEVYTNTKHDGININDRRDLTLKDTTRVQRELAEWWSSPDGVQMKNDVELKRLEDERAQIRLEQDRKERAAKAEAERIEKERLEQERIERERLEKERQEKEDAERRVRETPQGLAYLTWVARNLEFMDQFGNSIPENLKDVLGKLVSNTLVQAGQSLTPDVRSQITIPEEYGKIMDSDAVKAWWN